MTDQTSSAAPSDPATQDDQSPSPANQFQTSGAPTSQFGGAITGGEAEGEPGKGDGSGGGQVQGEECDPGMGINAQ